MSRKTGAIFVMEGEWVRMIAFDKMGVIRDTSLMIEIALLDAIDAGVVIPCESGSTPVMQEIDELSED